MGKENPNLNKYVYFKWELNWSINTDNEMVNWYTVQYISKYEYECPFFAQFFFLKLHGESSVKTCL